MNFNNFKTRPQTEVKKTKKDFLKMNLTGILFTIIGIIMALIGFVLKNTDLLEIGAFLTIAGCGFFYLVGKTKRKQKNK